MNTSSLATSDGVHYGLAAVLGVIGLSSLVLNIIFLVTFAKVRRLRKPVNWFLLNLMVADLVAVVCWLAPSTVAASTWEWLLGDVYCVIQGVISSLCYYVNFHMFAIIGFEKYVKFCHPSRHATTFFGSSVLVIILSVWAFDLVIALFPVYGWGTLAYIPATLQCHFLYEKSISQESFVAVQSFGIPFLFTAAMYIVILKKIRKSSRPTDSEGHANKILEEDISVPKASFAQKLHAQQALFVIDAEAVQAAKHQGDPKKELLKQKKLVKKIKKKDKKPKNTSSTDISGSRSSSDSSSEEDVESRVSSKPRPIYDVNFDYLGLKRKKLSAEAEKKRVYKLKRGSVSLALTMCISWFVYVVLWLPFLVVSFVWTFFPDDVPDEVRLAVSALTFAGLVTKPLVYLTNSGLRGGVRETLCTGPNE